MGTLDGIITLPIGQMNTLKFREITSFIHSYTYFKWSDWDLNQVIVFRATAKPYFRLQTCILNGLVSVSMFLRHLKLKIT